MSQVKTDRLRCGNCDLSWCFIVPLFEDALTIIRDSGLCAFCFAYERTVKDLSPILNYNPYDMTQWISRLIRKETFYCCQCKTDLLKNHTLQECYFSTVKVYSLRTYPFHTLCKPCLVFAVAGSKPYIVPSINCCHQDRIVKITMKTKHYRPL